ncbi:acyl-CoA synthetase [Actinospongicola halichondriae]|uniref:acyl-CoA synthetase n=1 Tax=Actinospongicola halichondriae TaxID=3236844 RepID=UPI003D5A09F9
MTETGFWRLAEADGSWTALIDTDESPVSAGQLVGRANQLANGLVALGLEPGDTVAAVLPNCREFLELYLAALQVGLIFTPINHHLVGPEIAYIVNDSEASVLVGHADFAAALEAASGELTLAPDRWFAIGDVAGYRPLDELTDGKPATAPPGRTAGMAMHYTSGTTGRPKGVRRAMAEMDPSDLGSLYAMFMMLFGVEPFDDNVHLTGSPLYHTAVLMWTANSLHLGHTVVLMEKWTPEDCLRLIDRHRVTTSHMVPTQFHRMLGLPEDVRARYDVSSTRCMVHAAAPCPPEVKKQMISWWGNSIMEYYAATEGGGTIITAEEWLEKEGSVGKAWAGAEIRIYDDEGKRLGPNEVGTIYMGLTQADFEYKGDEGKTKKNRIYEDDGAFFTVGDVGELDDDGYLFLRDRKIDMIISGGVNIYPSEIEGAFLSNPVVGDVAVFGIPNDDWGEEVKAVIEPAEGVVADEQYEADLRTWAEANLASYKRPRSYDFTDEMPRESTGKLFKRKLRDPYWEGRAQI